MKATWERNEQTTLIELCKNAQTTARINRNNIKDKIDKYNAEIDALPWYKRMFKFKVDIINDPFNKRFYAYNIHRVACFDISDLGLKIKTCFANGAASITLSDTEIELLVRYTQFVKEK